MAQTVVGIFDDSNAAQSAVQRLTAYGFTESDIDITTRANVSQSGTYAGSNDRADEGFGDRVSRFFRNLFDDEDDVEKYSDLAKKGTVVSVYADSREEAERAADILDEFGAINVDERTAGSETASMEGNISDKGFNPTDQDSNRSIPVIEEEIQIGKREVERGGMRLRSRIIERPVEESLRLREERLRVERNPVNRPATESDLNTFREGEIEVRERAEVPVVNKQARVVEEIKVRKDVEERDEVVRDTVRKTEVDVENLEEGSEQRGSKSKSKKKN